MTILNLLRSNAAPWEVAWSFFPFVGMLISGWLIWDCIKDLRAVNADQGTEEIDRIAGRQAVRNESLVFCVLVSLCIVGIVAIFSRPVNQNRQITSVALAVTVAFTLTPVLLAVKSLLNRVDRHRIVTLYRQKHVYDRNQLTMHRESMTELRHNTEVSTEARDYARKLEAERQQREGC